MASRIFMRCYFLVKGVLHLLKKKMLGVIVTEQIKPLAQLFANTHTMFWLRDFYVSDINEIRKLNSNEVCMVTGYSWLCVLGGG